MMPFDRLAALNIHKVTPADRDGFKTLLGEVLPKGATLTAAQQTVREKRRTLTEVKRGYAAQLAEREHKVNERLLSRLQEGVDNPCYDLAGGAQSWHSDNAEVELLQEVLNYIEYVLEPALKDQDLETGRDLSQVQHVEAAIYAADSHAALLEKLERVGVYQSHGRVVAISEHTQRLQAIAEEAGRQAAQAEADLKSYRDQQLLRTQQRQAGSAITKAEAVYSAVQLSRNEVTQ